MTLIRPLALCEMNLGSKPMPVLHQRDAYGHFFQGAPLCLTLFGVLQVVPDVCASPWFGSKMVAAATLASVVRLSPAAPGRSPSRHISLAKQVTYPYLSPSRA